MKFTSASVHALHALKYLAKQPRGQPIVAETIATAEGLHWRFLLRLLNLMEKAGILRTKRGRFGGYMLARPARSITLLEVVEAVDGPVRFDVPPPPAGGGARLDAELRRVCDAAAEAARRRLARVTVADLAGGGAADT
jgi:Rrf2 family protein